MKFFPKWWRNSKLLGVFDMSYSPPQPQIWQGRVDSLSERDAFRWHQRVVCVDLSKSDFPEKSKTGKNLVLLGFASDLGIARNHGRVGAAQGPLALRKALAGLPVHFDESVTLYDCGDILCAGSKKTSGKKSDILLEAQQELAILLDRVLSAGATPIVMGGGHELAFGHYLGLASHLEKNSKNKKRIGIINFDAHFDLRPFVGESTSGTPFSQISDFCSEKGMDFSYLVLGIQKITNTKSLFQRAQDLGVSVIERHEMVMANLVALSKKITDFLHHQDHIYVTICLDAFSASVAPGVSAPTVDGIPLDVFFTLLTEILKSGKVACLDVAELSPPLDPDGRTAKLAAKIIFEMVGAM